MKPLHSTVAERGKYVTQIITLITGYKKTFRGVDTGSFLVGEFTHFNTKDGRKVQVRTEHVGFIETTGENE